jgi:hypothetical protein
VVPDRPERRVDVRVLERRAVGTRVVPQAVVQARSRVVFERVVAEATGAAPVGQAPFALPLLLAVGFVAYSVVGRS